MSKQSINNYYNKVSQYQRFGGTRNETSIRRAFANLLEEYCLPKKLTIVDEIKLKHSTKRPDGTVKDANQLDWGYWESKDKNDDLDKEIENKIEIGYPTFNILFENSELIVLIQKNDEVMRGNMNDPELLHRIITAFVEYERPEIADFRLAVEKFKTDIPDIVESLRKMIEEQSSKNEYFKAQREKFWNVCRESINPEISAFDIREMLIQHILTAEIFDTVFGDSHFHRENNIAKELEIVVNTFFTGAVRRNTLAAIDNYYKTIKAEAARIENHHEKQNFLKVVYENFYKAYNPKGADRLGVVYTPNEVVKFMVESTDYLLEKYFNKSLSDRNVQILDPATGTGTFIAEIIDHIPPQYLKYKYLNEIHCNELAILPYYIANLNIEYSYQQKMNEYVSFENIVFVDTLDNQGFSFTGKQQKMFALSAENLKRIVNQNDHEISVIIGNPPYNATQKNENDNNKNTRYPLIDERIKNTYVKYSHTQNLIKIYDMYARFFRWATDRIKNDGIVAFISNRSFIDSRTFDGFRKSVADEYNYIYIIDLQGDIRADKDQINANIFGIMTGVAITFLVKDKTSNSHVIQYFSENSSTVKEKFRFLWQNSIKNIEFSKIKADKRSNWLRNEENDFADFITLVDNDVKKADSKNALFKYFSLGTNSGADEWFWDFDSNNLKKKARFLIEVLNKESQKHKGKKELEVAKEVDLSIKWTRELRKVIVRGYKAKFESKAICQAMFRPFTKMNYFYERKLLKCDFLNYKYFPKSSSTNKLIAFNQHNQLNVLSSNKLVDLHFIGDAQCVPYFFYDSTGEKSCNLTDWGLEQFREHYEMKNVLLKTRVAFDNDFVKHLFLKSNENFTIQKEDIFHYCYAVMHNPAYRKKYDSNLKQDFPRIPFYKNFFKWAAWGKELMNLHIDYELVEPYSELKVLNETIKIKPKVKLKAHPESGEILLDENTTITNIPDVAWKYQLGNRSALHWILDQYKEKLPSDKTIAEKFNPYKFSQYKETVIDLIKRITTVSARTMLIVNQMEAEEPHGE